MTLKYVTDSWGTDGNGFKMVITAYKDAKDYGCRLVLFCINRKFNLYLDALYYELKYAFLIGMVLFVKKMGECLVFITILFVTPSVIVAAVAMKGLQHFAIVSKTRVPIT